MQAYTAEKKELKSILFIVLEFTACVSDFLKQKNTFSGDNLPGSPVHEFIKADAAWPRLERGLSPCVQLIATQPPSNLSVTKAPACKVSFIP